MSQPLTERYNNPGAVEFKPWMANYGARLGPNGRYAAFDSPDQGYSVMGRILDTYGNKHGLNTVSGIINRWAPRTSDNNSTDQYITNVARAIGIDPNAPLTPEQRPALMRAMATYEAGRPQPGPGAPVPASAPTGSIMPQQPMMPAMPAQPQQPQGLWGNLAGFVTNTMQNPLFNAGMGMVAAGAKGQGIGSGFLMANEAMAQASERQRQARAQQAEMDAQRARAGLWQDLMTNPNPAWAKDLPAGSLELARALGPDAGSKLAVDLVSKNQATWLEREKLRETQRDNEIRNKLAEAQLNETRAMNDERRLTQETVRRQREQETALAQREAEMEAEITGATPPERPAPVPPPVVRPPVTIPNIRRQSTEPEAPADPMLVPTQAAVPPGGVQQGAPDVPASAAPTQPTVRIQRGGKTEEVSPEEARAYGQRLLALPKFRFLGQEILKRADEAEKRTQLNPNLRTEVEKKEFEVSENYARLQRVQAMFRPEFQEVEQKIGFQWAAMKDKSQVLQAVFGKLTPDQTRTLEDYAAYRAEAFDTLNDYIKSVTGAAMTNAEAERILKGIINPGQSWWDGDSPAEFQSKLNNALKSSRLAMIRMSYAKTVGRPWNSIPMTEMRRILDSRGDAIAGELSRQGVPPQQIDERVRSQLRTEFGGAI